VRGDKYRGVGYRTWTLGGACPPLTPTRYRRQVADAQPRHWWYRRALEVGHTPGQGHGSMYFKRAAPEDGGGCPAQLTAAGAAAAAASPAAPPPPRSVRATIIATTPLPDGPPSHYTGLFTGLPAFLVVHIAEFSYGARVVPCGYTPLLSKSQRVQWAAFEARQLTLAAEQGGQGAVPGAGAVDEAGEGGCGDGSPRGVRVVDGVEEEDDEEGGVDDEEETGAAAGADSPGAGGSPAARPPGPGSPGAGPPSLGSPGLPAARLAGAVAMGEEGAAPVAAAAAASAAGIPHGFEPGLGSGSPPSACALPPLGRHNSHALALACRELLLLFSGRVGPASGWGRVLHT